MPIYEYHCQGCGHEFQLLRSMGQAGDDALCLRCNRRAVRKLSVIAPVLRGGLGVEGAEEVEGRACGCGGACRCGASLN